MLIVVYHVPMVSQSIYGWSDEGGEDGDRKEGNEIPGGLGRVEIT